MPLFTKVGSFVTPSGNARTAVTGVGFTPKAIIVWKTSPGGASGTWADDTAHSIGFATSSTNQYVFGGAAGDAISPTQTARYMRSDSFASEFYRDVGYTGHLVLVTMDADGFTYDIPDDLPSRTYHFLALGGDITAKVVPWTTPTAAGLKAVTGAGFKPDVVLHASGIISTALPGSAAHVYSSVGMMNKHGQQGANAVFQHDNQAAANSSRWQQTDAAFVTVEAGEQLMEQAHYVSMDADGFTMNFSNLLYATAFHAFSLCLQGVSSKIGAFHPNNTAVNTVTRAGFQPKAALLMSNTNTPALHPVTGAYWSLGASDGVNERLAAFEDVDTANPAQAHSIFYTDKATGVLFNRTVHSTGDLTMGSDGFTVNWSSAVNQEHLYLLLGDAGVSTYPAKVTGL